MFLETATCTVFKVKFLRYKPPKDIWKNFHKGKSVCNFLCYFTAQKNFFYVCGFWPVVFIFGTAWRTSKQPGACRNSLTYIGTAWCMSEQPDVCWNSLMHVGTAWHIYRYSLMYVGTAWHMSFRSVLKISGRVCTHMVYMILALNKTFQILIISAWLQLLFNIYCTIFMKCYSCIPVYLYICHLTMSVFTDQVFSMFCLSYFFFQFVMI